jgi:polysaccharide deacetylase 2 family uncharacterized protein YibQ
MAKKELPAKGKSKSRGARFERLVTVGIVVAVIAIGLILWGPLKKYRIGEEKKPVQQAQKAEPAAGKQAPEKKPEKKSSVGRTEQRKEPVETKKSDAKKSQAPSVVQSAPKKAIVAIVIDDLGQDLKPAQELASLPYKVTFAIMPGLTQSKKVAELAGQKGREILLHLPMEYRGKNGKPAQGMLRSNMTPMDFLNTLTDDIAAVPGAVGVNNHEGSSLTENKEAMKFLMAELKARNLLFLDSLTTPKSVAYATAREFGLHAGKRDVFLDNDSEHPDAIARQLQELGRIAKDRGQAIGIGHPHPETISELRKWLSAAAADGIEVVPVSKLMQ